MLHSALVKKLIGLALEEDLAFGDITSRLVVPEDAVCSAQLVAREQMVVCGLEVVSHILDQLGAMAEVESLVEDGLEVGTGTVLLKMQGVTRDLLAAERTILNFLQRMCGIATFTKKFASEAGGIVILDTRKTLPGWRMLDKYAVSVGGGRNHRMSLGDMLLIKNNHIDASAGSTIEEKIRTCLKEAFKKKPYFMPLEVEVRNIEELRTVLEFKPDAVMFDNMTREQVSEGCEMISRLAPDIVVELSGNMTVERLKSLQNSGVQCASVGALTTEARNTDISMRIVSE